MGSRRGGVEATNKCREKEEETKAEAEEEQNLQWPGTLEWLELEWMGGASSVLYDVVARMRATGSMHLRIVHTHGRQRTLDWTGSGTQPNPNDATVDCSYLVLRWSAGTRFTAFSRRRSVQPAM